MGYVAKTKAESRKLIVSLGLNRVPEIFLEKTDSRGMREFFETYPSALYVLRDAEHSSSQYFYVTNAEECIEKAALFSGKVILAVSTNGYKNKVLLGAIEICGDLVRIVATQDETLDHRTMYGRAEYSWETKVTDKRLSNIPEIDYLFDYLYRNKLLDITVEFTIYDRPVGVNQERMVINELRNY